MTDKPKSKPKDNPEKKPAAEKGGQMTMGNTEDEMLINSEASNLDKNIEKISSLVYDAARVLEKTFPAVKKLEVRSGHDKVEKYGMAALLGDLQAANKKVNSVGELLEQIILIFK